ncbi:MAG: hypothetical protein RR459_04050, partial [Christensenellaceae bacterium]
PIPSAQPTVTVVPTEQAGAVNIVMYVYDQGKASKGYKVTVDETSLITDENGKVEFKNVTVESHKLIVKSPDGEQSVGMVYLSRGDDTAILDQAMGGKYEISVARNTDRIYLNMEFQGENALQITSASNQNTQPAKPSAIISSSFKITAEFLDKNGKPMSNLGIQVVSDMPMLGLTDSKGYFVLNGASFTTYNWAALANGVSPENAATFVTEIKPGISTSLVSSDDGTYVIQTAATSSDLFIQFEQKGDTFVVKSVSDKIPGGISPMILGIIVVLVIVVVLIVVLVVLKKRKKNKRIHPSRTTAEPRTRKDFEQPKKTGGSNKFDDRNKL